MLRLDIDQTKTEITFRTNFQEDPLNYLFFINDKEVTNSLEKALDFKTFDHEAVINIVYQPQAEFVVRSVTRCTSSMPGHAEAVVSIQFSPDGKQLASGSGDTSIRLWDLTTETPLYTCNGHKQWVLCVSWAPDGKKLASSCKSGELRIWDPETGKQIGKPMIGHKKWINCLSWEPYHLSAACRRIASAGCDGDVRIWDVLLSQCIRVLTSHTNAVTSVRWGGLGLIYTSSKDRTIKMWRAEDGALCRTLTGHAHWVNNLTLNTDYVLRAGPFFLGVHDDDKILKARQSKFNTLWIETFE